MAYLVGRDQLSSLLRYRFRTQLARDIVIARKTSAAAFRDERLGPFLTSLVVLGADGSLPGDGDDEDEGEDEGRAEWIKVRPETVDALAPQAFPLCMQHLHACLRRDSHLKYHGRMQYGLFLKDAGLSLDQALAFWRGAFAQKVHNRVKENGYFYSIRHYFGQEGSRKNYEAQTCAQIKHGGGPLHGQNHGCPYTHMSESTLVAALKTLPVVEGGSHMSARDIETIVGYAKASNATEACRHCFGATHGAQGGGGGGGGGGESSAAFGGGGGNSECGTAGGAAYGRAKYGGAGGGATGGSKEGALLRTKFGVVGEHPNAYYEASRKLQWRRRRRGSAGHGAGGSSGGGGGGKGEDSSDDSDGDGDGGGSDEAFLE